MRAEVARSAGFTEVAAEQRKVASLELRIYGIKD